MFAGKPQRSLVGLLQAQDRFDDRGLTRTVCAEDDPYLAGEDLETSAGDGRHRAIGYVQIGDGEQRRHGCDPRYASMTRGSARISAGLPSAIFSPKLSTTIPSETDMTTFMLCSISSRVRPDCVKRPISCTIACASCATMPCVGSSRMSSLGSAARARAISTRRWSP